MDRTGYVCSSNAWKWREHCYGGGVGFGYVSISSTKHKVSKARHLDGSELLANKLSSLKLKRKKRHGLYI